MVASMSRRLGSRSPVVVTPGSHLRRPSQERYRRRGIPRGSDDGSPTGGDNGSVGEARDWWKGWAERGRQLASAQQALTVAGAALGLLALAESIARAAVTGATAQFGLALALVALATTLPLAFLDPAGAAIAITAATVLSLAGFHALTVAGLGAQLIVLYRLGRSSSRRDVTALLSVGLAVPFLVLALVGARPIGSDRGVLTVLLASLAPATALTGIAARVRKEAMENRAAREVIAQTLIEHTARGERARIARELHDVVAHHISIVAVQAESARLTTPGMPPAGSQRLSAIGDTARAALTEMPRLLGVLREDVPTDFAERRPQPGLGQLNELLDEARDASGAGARLILRGPPVTLDPGVELAAASSRKHSPTPGVTRQARPSTLSCTSPTTPCGFASATMDPALPRLRRMAATGCPGCENGPQPSVANCGPAPQPEVGFSSRPRCPPRPRRPDDRQAGAGADRRRGRPTGRTRRLRLATGEPARLHCRGHGVWRDRGRADLPRPTTRRRRHGRPHAGHGRHRGDQTSGRLRSSRATHPHPHDLRPGRVRVRRASRGCQPLC